MEKRDEKIQHEKNSCRKPPINDYRNDEIAKKIRK